MPHGNVEALLRERAQAVGHIQLDLDLRVAAQELGQQRHQLLPGKRHRRGDAQEAARGTRKIADIGVAGCNLLECAAHRIDQLPAGIRQRRAARGALHERNAGSLFQISDVLAHRSLAHAEPRCSLAEAALLMQHDEPVQVLPEILYVVFVMSKPLSHHFQCS